MKTLLIVLVIVVVDARNASAQGMINFVNYVTGNINAPVYESDQTTKLSGSQFMAELLVGSTAGNLASVATTGFLTGTSAGYFNGGATTVIGMGPGQLAWVQVDVWNTTFGASFAQAKASGLGNSWWASPTFSVILGGGTVNPTLPAILTGLGNSPVYLNSVPEPATTALLGVGVAVLLVRYHGRVGPDTRRRQPKLSRSVSTRFNLTQKET